MRTCEQFAEIYELYALGALEPAEQSEIEEHLRTGCPACSSGIRSAAAFGSILATMPEQVQPPSRLRRRVLASVGIGQSRRIWSPVLAALSVALMMALVWLGREKRDRDLALVEARDEIRRSAADLAGARSALQFLDAPETRQVVFGQGKPQPPRGSVFVNPERGVLLIASNLPQAPAGKTYELWLIPRKGAPQPAGLFQSDPQGSAMHLRPGPVDVAATGAVAVTLEPAGGSNAPTATPVVVAPFAGVL